MKLNKKIFLTGEIVTETGLHIGGSDIGLEIGGADSIVIRNPVNQEPYIPGSSLKGKMRSLTEKLYGKINIKKDKAGPCNCGECDVCILFGVGASEDKSTPTRLYVRDGKLLNKDLLEKLDTDMMYTEVKTESTIDRVSSKATPRQIERVPAGARFELSMVLNIYDRDDETKLLSNVFESLQLVQDDYLGGNGSRGYGVVKFRINSIREKTEDDYKNNNNAKEKSDVTIPETLKN